MILPLFFFQLKATMFAYSYKSQEDLYELRFKKTSLSIRNCLLLLCYTQFNI
jgi:hypothetical protein